LATLPLANLGGPSVQDFGVLAALGTIQLGLGLFLFMRGAQKIAAAQTGLLCLLEVILGPLWVWLAFAETPGTLALLGGAIVFSALVGHAALGVRLRWARPSAGTA
jgi:drug/metabolite transporter (DMT)-like permease